MRLLQHCMVSQKHQTEKQIEEKRRACDQAKSDLKSNAFVVCGSCQGRGGVIFHILSAVKKINQKKFSVYIQEFNLNLHKRHIHVFSKAAYKKTNKTLINPTRPITNRCLTSCNKQRVIKLT